MPVTKYIWDVENDSYLMETDENDVTTAVYTNEPTEFGNLVSQDRPSDTGTSYYHYDALGSTRALTDGTDTRTDAYLYSGFGETVAESGTTESPFRFAGQLGYYFDSEIGLYYVRRRLYRSTIARWISRDPAWPFDSVNVFQYVTNNPIRTIDPAGLFENKPKERCLISGTPVTLVFDGKSLSGSGHSWPAVSGKPISVTVTSTSSFTGGGVLITITTEYIFDYSIARQKKNWEGPSKEGRYWIGTCFTNSCANAWRHCWYDPRYSAWGSYSWHLHPYPSTDMSGEKGDREKFFLHGGTTPGSAGCIDLMNNVEDFKKAIIDAVDNACCCYIDVHVRYGKKIHTITATKTSFHAIT